MRWFRRIDGICEKRRMANALIYEEGFGNLWKEHSQAVHRFATIDCNFAFSFMALIFTDSKGTQVAIYQNAVTVSKGYHTT